MEIFIPDSNFKASQSDEVLRNNAASHHNAASQHNTDDVLKRTTHLAVSAHQDDIEFMAYDGILKCCRNPEWHFTAVVLTDGAGSPRNGRYADYTDEEMKRVRREEQKKAAVTGGYNAQIFLDLPSARIKDPSDKTAVESLKEIIAKTEPQYIYTHNIADKHDTHIAAALRLVQALRELDYIPEAFYGCEVWRGLDWVNDDEKIVFDVGGSDDLAAALLSAFDSQIAGGKRYDLAVMGRRRANATFSEPHVVDRAEEAIFAMDLLPLLRDKTLSVLDYIEGYILRFCGSVKEKLAAFS